MAVWTPLNELDKLPETEGVMPGLFIGHGSASGTSSLLPITPR